MELAVEEERAVKASTGKCERECSRERHEQQHGLPDIMTKENKLLSNIEGALKAHRPKVQKEHRPQSSSRASLPSYRCDSYCAPALSGWFGYWICSWEVKILERTSQSPLNWPRRTSGARAVSEDGFVENHFDLRRRS